MIERLQLDPFHKRLLIGGLVFAVLFGGVLTLAGLVPYALAAGVAWVAWSYVPSFVATTPVVLGEPAVLEVEVPADTPLGVDLKVQSAPGLYEPFPLVGTVVVDGVDFPVRIEPGAPPVSGLSKGHNGLGPRGAQAGGRAWSGSVWLGTIPASDEARTARVTLDLTAEGDGSLRHIELRARTR